MINNNCKYMRKSKKNSQSGFSLIEVLIVVVIIGISVLGVSKLQLLNTQTATTAYMDTQVTIHLEEIIQHLRSNKQPAIDGDLNTRLISIEDLPKGETLAIEGRYSWAKNMSNQLPNSMFSIQCNNSGLCLLAVQYTATQGMKEQVFVTQL